MECQIWSKSLFKQTQILSEVKEINSGVERYLKSGMEIPRGRGGNADSILMHPSVSQIHIDILPLIYVHSSAAEQLLSSESN